MPDKMIPEYIRPTRDLVLRAFPNPEVISGEIYFALLFVLQDYFSFRGLATFMEWTIGKEYVEALHDVYGVCGGSVNIADEAIAVVEEKLRANGFDEWQKSHEKL